MVDITFDNTGKLERDVVCEWEKVKHFTLAGHTKTVTIKAYKAEGNGGILASFNNSVVTDDSWECADMSTCNVSDCAIWKNATTSNDLQIPENERKQINSTACWIWAANKSALSVWCRKRFAASPSPQRSTQSSTKSSQAVSSSIQPSTHYPTASSQDGGTTKISTATDKETTTTSTATDEPPTATSTVTASQSTGVVSPATATAAITSSTINIVDATSSTEQASSQASTVLSSTIVATVPGTAPSIAGATPTPTPVITTTKMTEGPSTTVSSSTINPTTTASTGSSSTPKPLVNRTEILAKYNDVNATDKNAVEIYVNITEEYIRDSEKTTNDIIVVAAPIFEEKVTEYANSYLQTRHNGTYEKKTEKLVVLMKSLKIPEYGVSHITFPLPEKKWNEMQDFIEVPLDILFSNNTIFIGIYYNVSSKSDLQEATGQKLVSKLISAKILLTNYSNNITFSLKHGNYSRDNVFCSYVNESNTAGASNTRFSTRGCSMVESTGTRTKCTCNHMTSFAVMTKIDGKKISGDPNHRKALSIITYVGLTLSLIGETLTVASYVFLIGLNTEQAHLHTNLALSLGLAQIFFMAGISASSSEIACLLVTTMIHYFYLVTFCWMLVEGFHLYLMIVKVFNENSYLKLYYLFSWVTPMIIVSLSLIAAAASPAGIHGYVSNEDICWISHENNYIWFFLGPVLLICLANLVLLILVVREMTRMNKTKGAGPSIQFRKSVKACLLLFPILGTTWVFAVLLMLKPDILAVEYIFNILNSLQGFMIFLFYVMRSSEIRAVLQQRKARWTNSLDFTNQASTYQKTKITSDRSQPTSASSIKPILGSWFSPESRTPSPFTNRSPRSTPSPRETPSPRDTPTPRTPPSPRGTPGARTRRVTPDPRGSPRSFNTPSRFTTPDPADLFEHPRSCSNEIDCQVDEIQHYAETSA